MRFVRILFTVLFLISVNCLTSFSHLNSIKVVYITDLNLFPTPVSNNRTKSDLEKNNGLLIYESQAVFQDLINYINLKVNPDFVVFGGNNICPISSSNSKNNAYDLFQLFLDMASQLKSPFFVVPGDNEVNSTTPAELLRVINSSEVDSDSPWWSYNVPNSNFIFIGLSSQPFFTNPSESQAELNWLESTLSKNKSNNVCLFLHDSIVQPDGKVLSNVYALKLFKMLKKYNNVKLISSGNTMANRIKLSGSAVYTLSSSPVAYPCTFRIFEISNTSLSVKTVKIPLKGIIKKAEKYLFDSESSKSINLNSIKSIKSYVEGSKVDNSYIKSFSL